MKSQPRPAPPPVKPAPTREQIIAEQAAKKKKDAVDKIKVVNESKVTVAERQGVYNDIRTSRQGDVARYNTRTFNVSPYKRGGIVRFGQVA